MLGAILNTGDDVILFSSFVLALSRSFHFPLLRRRRFHLQHCLMQRNNELSNTVCARDTERETTESTPASFNLQD